MLYTIIITQVCLLILTCNFEYLIKILLKKYFSIFIYSNLDYCWKYIDILYTLNTITFYFF